MRPQKNVCKTSTLMLTCSLFLLHSQNKTRINKVWRGKKKKRKPKKNWRKTVSLSTGRTIWCSWAFSLLQTHSSSFSPTSAEGKQKWLLHRVAAPKEETIPTGSWFHFPTSSCSNCRRESSSLLSPLISSDAWHFPGKQYLHSTLEMCISFSPHEACAHQQGKIPAHMPDSHYRERWCWRQRNTWDRSCYWQMG